MGTTTKESGICDLVSVAAAVVRGEVAIPRKMMGDLIQGLVEKRGGKEKLARLTKRQLEVLALLCQGALNATIARQLIISPQTARTHIQNILEKLEVHSRLEAAAFATRHGLTKTMSKTTSRPPTMSS